MEIINQNNLLKELNSLIVKNNKCNHHKYFKWENFNIELLPDLVYRGIISQKENNKNNLRITLPDYPYYSYNIDNQEDSPIILSDFPYYSCKIYQCKKCNNLFFNYFEKSTQEDKYRIIKKELIDIESIEPTQDCLILSKYYKYTLHKKKDMTYELAVCKPISTGMDVVHTLTKEEFEIFKLNGIKGLKSRMDDMNENYKNYEINYWR